MPSERVFVSRVIALTLVVYLKISCIVRKLFVATSAYPILYVYYSLFRVQEFKVVPLLLSGSSL